MVGFSMVHMLIFGIVAVLLFGNRLPSLAGRYAEFASSKVECANVDADVQTFRDQHRGTAMREHFKKFLWTSKFWAMLGVVGCVSGLYFQRVAANGSGLWCLG